MGVGDGTILGITKIFDSGPPTTRWNLVIVSDGYRATQMGQFAADAQAVADRLLAEPPFDQLELTCAINIYRLDVTSTDQGADKPNCGGEGGGDGSTAATYFDSTFCSDGVTQRLLYGDAALVQVTVEALLPEWHQIIVLVNDSERGGAGGTVGWFSNGGSDWREVAIHELGHSAFGLADEYDYGGPDMWPGGEPGQANVSAVANPVTVKWSALVTAGPATPTRANPDCTETDPGPSPVPDGTVGTFEGAKYSHCGLFRPVWNCMMRDTGAPFCPVCRQEIIEVMAPFSAPAAGDVVLGTPSVVFNAVPTGLTVVRAARFDVTNCFPVTFQAMTMPAPPFALESAAVTIADPSGPSPWRAYFWFRFTAGGAIGAVPPQQVTLRCLETGEDFEVTLTGEVIERPSVATQLVFDKSGSMLSVTADGRTKEEVLKDAATVFTDLLWDDNGIGLNAYDHDPHPILDVQVAGAPGSGGGRDDAIAAIGAHSSNPGGFTAIGDGIELAKAKLDSAPGSWDHKAMIVLTDGIETADKRVADVADTVINEKVFAIGMGTAEQIQPNTLNALTNGTGGYLLMTGNLSGDETFLLEKYYLQILAGVNNNELVLDPEGWARPGVVERIPFDITESDIEITGLVLGRPAHHLIMALETPDGSTVAFGDPSVIGRTTPRVLYMRAGLPLLAGGGPAHGGRWHLLLTIHPEYWKRGDHVGKLGLAAGGASVRYSANVTAYSNLRMAAAVHQDSLEPGARLIVRASLTEYGVPFRGHVAVTAELLRPDGHESLLTLHPVSGEPGAFQTSQTALQTGIYRFRILANGRTSREQRFTRETIRTAAVWHGGDRPGQSGGAGDPGSTGTGGPDWCAILECLLGRDVLTERLTKRLIEAGFDVEHLRACVARLCRGKPGRPGKPATLSADESARLLAQLQDVVRFVTEPDRRPD